MIAIRRSRLQVANALLEDLEQFYTICHTVGKFWKYNGGFWEMMDDAQIIAKISENYGHLPAAKKHGDMRGVLALLRLAAKHAVTVLNAPGTIDCDYRGEVKAILINHGSEPFTIAPGMRVAQMVVAAVEQVVWAQADTLPDTARADGGFGHTGH